MKFEGMKSVGDEIRGDEIWGGWGEIRRDEIWGDEIRGDEIWGG